MKCSRNLITAGALLCAMCLALGPGCGNGANGGSNNNGNPDAGGCYVSLGYSPSNPEVGDRISVDLTMSGGTPITSTIVWTVEDPFGGPVIVDLRNNNLTAEFVPTESGTYDVSVEVDSAEYSYCGGGWANITVAAVNARVENFILMLTPADLTLAPRQQKNFQVIGRTPQSNLEFLLEAGSPVSIELEGPNGSMDGFVRLTPVGSTLHQEGYYSTQSNPLEFRLFAMATYDVLVVPDTDTVAPAALTGQTVTDLSNASTFVFTQGELVDGEVIDANAQGLGDALVVLRCNDVPSAVGACIANGAFALYARPGTCTVTVVPPDGSQWPELVVPDSLGVEVVSGTSLSLDFDYRNLTFRAFSGQVVETSGATPVPNARITLISEQLADLADLTITGDGTPVGPLAVAGQWRGAVYTDAAGDYQFLSVPSGTYRAIIEPTEGQATVVDSIDLTAGDLVGHQTQLAEPVLLYGWVFGEPEVQGGQNEPAADVKVVAITDLGTGSAVQGLTDQTGYFELQVIDGATYTLRFIPDVAAELAWLVGLTVDVQGEQLMRGPNDSDLVLARGLRMSGQVTGPGSGEGVLMQIFCQDCGHINPLAEAFTGTANSFVLIVPDPGIEEASP